MKNNRKNQIKARKKYEQACSDGFCPKSKEIENNRIKVGNRQEIETLINEEAYLFAKYLRKESKEWKPRIVSL